MQKSEAQKIYNDWNRGGITLLDLFEKLGIIKFDPEPQPKSPSHIIYDTLSTNYVGGLGLRRDLSSIIVSDLLANGYEIRRKNDV